MPFRGYLRYDARTLCGALERRIGTRAIVDASFAGIRLALEFLVRIRLVLASVSAGRNVVVGIEARLVARTNGLTIEQTIRFAAIDCHKARDCNA